MNLVGLLHFIVDLANVSLLETTLEIAPSYLLKQIDVCFMNIQLKLE
jgi:hypothetical protein